MPNMTLNNLREAMASMYGMSYADDLSGATDQASVNLLADIDRWINAAYFDCYAPVDGMRAKWPAQC